MGSQARVCISSFYVFVERTYIVPKQRNLSVFMCVHVCVDIHKCMCVYVNMYMWGGCTSVYCVVWALMYVLCVHVDVMLSG